MGCSTRRSKRPGLTGSSEPWRDIRPVAGESDERDDGAESVVRDAQETRCSPCRTGPAILINTCHVKPRRHILQTLPSIPVKLPALVGTKN